MKKIVGLLIGLMFLTFGCAPSEFTPMKPPDLKYDKTDPYKVDLSNIPKPEKLEPIFLNENFEILPEDQIDKAAYIALAPKEYAKVGQLVKLAKTYKEIIYDQEKLVNTHIAIENSLKEYLELERAKAQTYQELWVNSENAYRQMEYYRKLDKVLTTGTFGAITIGAIIVAILAL